eukprot:scaffold7052_cov254-Pinguiococcus_pyrenoidosus.AAC.115
MMSTASEVSSAAPPSWAILQQQLRSMGRDFEAQKEAIESGDFGAHTDAKVRLFGHRPEDVRVTFYRDTAAWCPYCQKTWLLLEEKRIPFRVEKINMRSYGAKPKEFLEKVCAGVAASSAEPWVSSASIFSTKGPKRAPSGNGVGRQAHDGLPADHGHAGERTLGSARSEKLGRCSMPRYLTLPTIRKDAALMSRAEELLRLERELFSAWCQWCFRPDFGDMNKRNFEVRWALLGGWQVLHVTFFDFHGVCTVSSRGQEVLGRVDAALGDLPGPFFMGEEMSIVDLVYVSHVERQVSSLLYWKGYQIRSHRGAEDER